MFYLQTLHLIAWPKIYFSGKKQCFLRFDLRGHFEVILGQRKYFQTILPFTVKDLFSSKTGEMYLFQNIQKSSQAGMHRNGICIALWFESSAKSWKVFWNAHVCNFIRICLVTIFKHDSMFLFQNIKKGFGLKYWEIVITEVFIKNQPAFWLVGQHQIQECDFKPRSCLKVH